VTPALGPSVSSVRFLAHCPEWPALDVTLTSSLNASIEHLHRLENGVDICLSYSVLCLIGTAA
jgi:hypothetical protein